MPQHVKGEAKTATDNLYGSIFPSLVLSRSTIMLHNGKCEVSRELEERFGLCAKDVVVDVVKVYTPLMVRLHAKKSAVLRVDRSD